MLGQINQLIEWSSKKKLKKGMKANRWLSKMGLIFFYRCPFQVMQSNLEQVILRIFFSLFFSFIFILIASTRSSVYRLLSLKHPVTWNEWKFHPKLIEIISIEKFENFPKSLKHIVSQFTFASDENRKQKVFLFVLLYFKTKTIRF